MLADIIFQLVVAAALDALRSWHEWSAADHAVDAGEFAAVEAPGWVHDANEVVWSACDDPWAAVAACA